MRPYFFVLNAAKLSAVDSALQFVIKVKQRKEVFFYADRENELKEPDRAPQGGA
jgi:hypothetical protein